MNNQQIGQRIREYRIKYNLTQEQLAELLDLSTIFVGQIERGERNMSLDTLIKVSEHLHISLDYLIEGIKINANKKNSILELDELLHRCSDKQIKVITDLVKSVLPHLK